MSGRTALWKYEAVAAAISFALIFVAGLGRYLAVSSGVDEKTADVAARAAMLLFFTVFGFACMGLMLHVFIVLQTGIGNGAAPFVRLLAEHERGVTFGIWAFLGAGTLIALPAAMLDWGGLQLPIGKSKGVLVADIGMTLDEVKQRSTVKIKTPRDMFDGSSLTVEDVVFDYQIGNSRFAQSRYYWIETGKHGDRHVVVLNIGITPRKMPKKDLDAFQHRVQRDLLADGWMPGHFIAKSEETVRLWGGKTTAGDGRYWAKGNTLIILEISRMDEEKRDEPPGTGEYILTMNLRPKNHEPDLVYERAAWNE